MIAWTIYLMFAGAVALIATPRAFARWVALLTTSAGLVITLITLFRTPVVDLASFRTLVRADWIPPLGMHYHLAIDGITLTLILVTAIVAVSAAFS